MDPTTGSEPAVSLKTAGDQLGLCERRIRQLIGRGVLVSIGRGHARKISSTSVHAELCRRNSVIEKGTNNGNGTQNSEIDVKPQIADEELPKSSIPIVTLCKQTEKVVTSFPHAASNRENGGQSSILLPVSRAAKLVGLTPALLSREIRSGSIPSVQVGSRRRINADILRRWSEGR